MSVQPKNFKVFRKVWLLINKDDYHKDLASALPLDLLVQNLHTSGFADL